MKYLQKIYEWILTWKYDCVILWCLHEPHARFQPIFEYSRSQLGVCMSPLEAWDNTETSHTSCSSRPFLCFVSSFGTHNNALSIWLASAENVLRQVGLSESPNCLAEPLAHHRFRYSLHGKKHTNSQPAAPSILDGSYFPHETSKECVNSEWLSPTNGRRVFSSISRFSYLCYSCSPSIQSGQHNPCGLYGLRSSQASQLSRFPRSHLPQVECAYQKQNKLLVCPSSTQSLDFPTLWTQGLFFSAADVRTEIRQHLLPVVMNCTACNYFPVVQITEKFRWGEVIVCGYFVFNHSNFLNQFQHLYIGVAVTAALVTIRFLRYTLMPYV